MKKESKKNTKETALTSFLWMLTGSSSQVVLRTVFMAVLARLLSPADFGLLAVATMITGFAELFTQMGVGQAIVQLKKINNDYISTAFCFSLLNGLIFSVLFWWFSPNIAAYFEMPELQGILNIIVWMFPIRMISKVSYSLLQRDMQFKKLAGNEVISYLIGFGFVGIPMAYLGYGYMSLIWGTIVQGIIYSMLLFYLQPHSLNLKIEFSLVKELLSFGYRLTLGNFFNYFARQGDYFVISKVLGAESLGYYSRAFKLMNMSNTMVGSIMNKVLFASFSKMQGDEARVKMALTRAHALNFLAFVPTSILASILAPEIVFFLLGDKWELVILPLQILSLGIVFRVGYKIGGSFIKKGGLIKYHAWTQTIFFLMIIGGAYIGSSQGIEGVAVWVTLAIAINYIVLTGLAIKYSDYNWRLLLKSFIAALPLSIALGTAAFGMVSLARYYEMNHFISLLLVGLVLLVVIFLSLKFFRKIMLGEHGNWVLENTLGKIKVLNKILN